MHQVSNSKAMLLSIPSHIIGKGRGRSGVTVVMVRLMVYTCDDFKIAWETVVQSGRMHDRVEQWG